MSLSKREVFFINLGQWVVIGLVVFIAAVMWRTFGWVPFPIKTHQSEYSAIKTMDGTVVISFDCTASVASETEVHVHREVRHVQTGQVFVLPTNINLMPEGKREVTRTFYIPTPAPSGKYCVTSYADWRPVLALTDRRIALPEKCFEVR